MNTQRIIYGISLLTFTLTMAQAGDWPIYRGPNHDGISRETEWSSDWPKSGPRQMWQAQVGTGFSSFSVGQGRVYTMGNRNDTDTVYCFDALTGKTLWTHSYPSRLEKKFYEGGPGATPTIDGSKVYTLGKHGDLFCFEAATGDVLWKRNIATEEAFRLGDWGYSGSPFPDGDRLLLNAGPAGMAVDKTTGKTLWQSGDEEAGYSTPYPFLWQGKRYFIFSSGDSYSAVNPATGKRLWEITWITRYGVNAADPIVFQDDVFVSSGYSKGSALFRMKAGEPEQAWRERKYRNQFNSSILVEGHLYGFDGDNSSRAYLKCLEWKTGKVTWETDQIGFGSLLAAAGHLIILSPKGELIIAPISPREFNPVARAKILGGKCWTVPVLANGLLYCRNAAGDVVCVDLRKRSSTTTAASSTTP